MIEPVIFTPEADDDVAASYDWYESQEPGLGEDFLRSVEACVSGAPIRRFPLRFTTSRLSIAFTIYSVFHCSQDPKEWRKHLGY